MNTSKVTGKNLKSCVVLTVFDVWLSLWCSCIFIVSTIDSRSGMDKVCWFVLLEFDFFKNVKEMYSGFRYGF